MVTAITGAFFSVGTAADPAWAVLIVEGEFSLELLVYQFVNIFAAVGVFTGIVFLVVFFWR